MIMTSVPCRSNHPLLALSPSLFRGEGPGCACLLQSKGAKAPFRVASSARRRETTEDSPPSYTFSPSSKPAPCILNQTEPYTALPHTYLPALTPRP